MHKINWEYTIPKLRNTLTAIIIILGILMIAFHWTTTDFVFRIMLGLVCVLDAIPAWMEKKRISAVCWFGVALCWFGLAVRSYFKYNI